MWINSPTIIYYIESLKLSSKLIYVYQKTALDHRMQIVDWNKRNSLRWYEVFLFAFPAATAWHRFCYLSQIYPNGRCDIKVSLIDRICQPIIYICMVAKFNVLTAETRRCICNWCEKWQVDICENLTAESDRFRTRLSRPAQIRLDTEPWMSRRCIRFPLDADKKNDNYNLVRALPIFFFFCL